MKMKRGCAFVLSLVMVLTLFAGLMSMNVNAVENKASVKLEVYDVASDGGFGTKLNTEGENKEALKLGKEYIIAIQAYNFSSLISEYGLNTVQLEVNYDYSALQQAMASASGSYIDESKFPASGRTMSGAVYSALPHVAANSKVDGLTTAEYPTDPDEFDKELRWFNVIDEMAGAAPYSASFSMKRITTEENMAKIIALVNPSTMGYSETTEMKALGVGEDKKMLFAFKFLAENIPDSGETTVSFETGVASSFLFSAWNEGGAGSTVRNYTALLDQELMEEPVPLTLEITNPSDTPVIVDPEDPDAESKWAEAVIKNLDENDQYQAGSEIHVKGIKREDGTIENLPTGLKVKLLDKDGTQLRFGDDSVTTVEELTVDAETNDYVIDLTKVRYADGNLITDQTLYLVVQEDPKGDSDKVEIIENSPAPVITSENATKVIDFATGQLSTGSEVIITQVNKPAYSAARALTAGSEVKMYTAEGLGTGVAEATVTAAEDATDNVVKATFDLNGKDDVKYYFTVTEPNGEDKIPSIKAESLKTVLQETSAQPILGKVTKDGAAIQSFEITGLKKKADDAAIALDENVTFTVMKDGVALEETTDYTVSAVADGKVTITFNTAQAPTVTVSATQTVDGVELFPSSAVEVEMKVGKPIFDSVDKKIDPVTGEIASGSTAIVTRTEDGPITENVELVLKKQDGTIVEGACVKSDSEPWTWTITLPEGADQTFSVIAQDTTPGSILKPSDPAYIAKNSIKPAGITITNNFTAEQEADKTYEVVVAHLENNVAIGKDDKLYIYKKGDSGAKGDLIATVNATPVSAVMTLADDSGVTYEFRHAFKTADLDFGAAGTDLWLEVEQTVNDITYMKSIAVHMDPVPSEIFIKSVIDPKAADANLNENGIPAVIVDENVRDAEQLAAMKPYLFKNRVAIPEGTALSKADLEGYTLNDKIVVEFNVAVTIDGIKSKYHAVPITWTEANFEEETRTAIDEVTITEEEATEETPATKIVTIEGGATSSEFKLYGMAYDMSTVLTGTDATNFTADDSHNAKPEVTLVVKQMPKLELAEGNWNETVEGERPAGEETTVHTYVHCYYRDPGFTIKKGGVELSSDILQTEMDKVARTAYEGETALENNFTAEDTFKADELIDIFDILNENSTITDENSPTGQRKIGVYKHGDYTIKYVYRYEDTEGDDLITVKNATAGAEHIVEITAERKLIVRQKRGDVNLDSFVDSGDISDVVLHALSVSDPIQYFQDNKYFDGFIKFVADVNIDDSADAGDISDLVLNALTVSDAVQHLKQDYQDFLDVEKVTRP